MKFLRMLTIAALAVAGISTSITVRADDIKEVDLNFQSGASFSGALYFSNNYNSLLGVYGTLTGYEYGVYGYAGSGTDPIDWVWVPGYNFASGSNDFGNFLMDGPVDSVYFNWIAFTYNYTGAPNIALALGDTDGVEIDYDDPLVSSTFVTTPEPNTILLLGTGLVGLAGLMHRKMARRKIAQRI